MNTTQCAFTTKLPFSANTSSTELRCTAILHEMTPVTNALARGMSNANGVSLKNFAKTAQGGKFISQYLVMLGQHMGLMAEIETAFCYAPMSVGCIMLRYLLGVFIEIL